MGASIWPVAAGVRPEPVEPVDEQGVVGSVGVAVPTRHTVGDAQPRQPVQPLFADHRRVVCGDRAPGLGEGLRNGAHPADSGQRGPRPGQLRCHRGHDVVGNSVAQQWVWRCLQGRTDRHAGVPHRQQYTVGGGARRRTAQRRQLDGVHDGVPAIHRFRERAELVDGPM
jgi:hypothetical protein